MADNYNYIVKNLVFKIWKYKAPKKIKFIKNFKYPINMDKYINFLNNIPIIETASKIIEYYSYKYFFGAVYVPTNPKYKSLITSQKTDHKFTIVKNSFIMSIDTRNYNMFNYLNIQQYNSICIITPQSYHFAELCLFYNLSFDNYYNKKPDNAKKMHEIYTFNDYDLNTEIKKKYDFMIMECYLENIYKYKTGGGIIEKHIIDIEMNALPNHNIYYDKLKHLKHGGDIHLYMISAITEKTILVLQNICNNFKYIKTVIDKNDFNIICFPYLYCRGFQGIKPYQTKITTHFYKFIKNTYKKTYKNISNKMKEFTDLLYMVEHKDIDNNAQLLEQRQIRNLNTAKVLAKKFGFEVYDYEINKIINLKTNLPKIFIFENPILYEIEAHQNNINKLKFNENTFSKFMKDLNTKYNSDVKQIKFKSTEIHNQLKEIIKLDNSLLLSDINNLGININNKMLSINWVKLYEILFAIRFNKLNKHKEFIKTLHICETNGESVNTLEYYIKRKMKKMKFEYNGILLNNNVDEYNIISNNKERWMQKDITNKKNIVEYKNLYDDFDWIISLYDTNIPFIQLQFSEILFILYNLKLGGNCIIKCKIPVDEKIILDMYYLLFNSFEKLYIIKPCQSKFVPEFFIVGINYNNLIITESMFDTLFDCFNEPNFHHHSVIEEEYSSDFENLFLKYINLLYGNYCEYVKNEIFFIDIWESMDNEVDIETKKTIDKKNYLFMKKYFKKH